MTSLKSTYGYNRSTNPLIVNFIETIEDLYLQESTKINPYIQALTNQVFWQSLNFYREMMQKFVGGELNVSEFAQKFSDQLFLDNDKAKNLCEDFKKQADIELNPNILKFSQIILDFEIPLEVYQNEVEELEEIELSEN